jgi:hypothetical protein
VADTIAVPVIAKRFGEQATFSAVTIAPANRSYQARAPDGSLLKILVHRSSP